jgi:hypothetical protein
LAFHKPFLSLFCKSALEDTYVPQPGEALLVHAQDISVKKNLEQDRGKHQKGKRPNVEQ